MTQRLIRSRADRAGKDEAGAVDTETVVESRDTRTEAEPVEIVKPNADAEKRRFDRNRWGRVAAYGVFPGLALLLTMGAGYLKWHDFSVRDSQSTATESVRAATESTVAMLSYRPDTVEKDLDAARDRLTGKLRDSYTSLTHDVVIPGSKQKQISAVATVPAAAAVSASANHAVVLVFVDQTVIIGNDPPTSTASRVRVALDKVDGRWLIAEFDPI
jgi:Mce-associated membrane protein